MANKVPRRRNARRLAGTAGCLGAAAAIAAHAASANFTGATTPASTTSAQAGTVYLTIPSAGSTNRLALTVSGLFPAQSDSTDAGTAPADQAWKQRVIEVTNAGNVDLATFSIGVQADPGSSSNLVTGSASTGLVFIVDECSVAWTENLTDTNNPTYTCSGTRNDVLGTWTSGVAPTDYAITTSLQTWTTNGSPALSNITLTAGVTNHLRFRFKLGALASTNAQGTSAHVNFTFGGTARNGTNQ